MSEEHIYSKDDVEWERVFLAPHASVSTTVDPFNPNSFIDLFIFCDELIDYNVRFSSNWNCRVKNNINDKEMLKTFNCGVGFCLIIKPQNLKKINKFFSKEFKPYVIGKITSGKNKVKLNGKIDWS